MLAVAPKRHRLRTVFVLYCNSRGVDRPAVVLVPVKNEVTLSKDPIENIYSVELHGACASYQVPRFRMRSPIFPNHTTPSLFHRWVCVWMRPGLRFHCRAGYDGEEQHPGQEPRGGVRETLAVLAKQHRLSGEVGAEEDHGHDSGQAEGRFSSRRPPG